MSAVAYLTVSLPCMVSDVLSVADKIFEEELLSLPEVWLLNHKHITHTHTQKRIIENQVELQVQEI